MKTGIKISRGSTEPLYQQIREAIVEKIESGEWPPHRQFPTYKALSEEMGVSMITIQQSVGSLVKEGILYRKRGVGVFAAPPKARVKSNTIALLLPDVRHSFFSNLAHIIQTYAAKNGYATLFFSLCDSYEDSLHVADLLPRQALAGVITSHAIRERFPAQFSEMLRESNPVVFIDGHSPEYDCIETDNLLGVEMALEHLVGLGHQRIAFAAGQILTKGVRERIESFRSILMRKGLPCDPPQVQVSAQSDDLAGEETAHTLLSLRDVPTAVLCMNDLVARGVMRVTRERGVKCPEEFSIVGFDDLDFAQYLDPPLTTVRQPVDELGQGAVDMLLERLSGAGPHDVPHRAVQLEPALVIRSSTAPGPGRSLPA